MYIIELIEFTLGKINVFCDVLTIFWLKFDFQNIFFFCLNSFFDQFFINFFINFGVFG